MNKDEILKQLTEVKDKIIFFKDLTEFQIKILIDEIVFAKFNKNETIFKQNDSKNQFIYYILSGSVKVNVTDKFGVTKTITTLL
ncbi:MAG: cyclic nucleotide-binding domain-containing protein [Campylobacterota bacterium]|nr:cyclic nucleotide-binding domain-containing protein [Campylobacterota bacterium]